MTVIYQAYGAQKIIHQSLFSVCSLLKQWPDFSGKILLYTDQGKILKEFFDSEPRVQIVDVSLDQIKIWSGQQSFVHRVKLEILLDALKYSTGNRVYLDGDTFFMSSPQNIFDSITRDQGLMHIKEYELRAPLGPLPRKIAKFVRGKTFVLKSGTKIQIPDTTSMWNAGVIGFSSERDAFLREALELTDVLYGMYPKHVMEQLAVSARLAAACAIHPSDDVINHYWQNKEFFQTYIDQFLAKHRNVKQAIEHMPDMNSIQPPVQQPKPKFALLRRFREAFSFPRPRA